MGRVWWFVTLGAGWLLFVACGGKSSSDADEGEGGSSGHAAGTGSAAIGGNSGGSGGSSNAGVGNTAGASGAAGSSSTAGSSSAGAAGASGAGASGSAGAPSRCEQPLESGSCNAYFPSYGFNTTNGYCQRFIYGGCGGNDNRFESLADCEATCGGSNEGGCPEVMPPEGSSCSLTGRSCHYDNEGCQCAPTDSGCLKIDPFCPALPLGEARMRRSEPERSAGVVVRYTYACQCTNGTWSCPALMGGPG